MNDDRTDLHIVRVANRALAQGRLRESRELLLQISDNATMEGIVNDPHPFEPRVLIVLDELKSLLVMLGSDAYDEYEDLWTHSLSEMLDLWEAMGEVQKYDAERMSRGLMSAANGILKHSFSQLDVAHEFFLIASTMLGLSYGLIDFDDPMTLETALLACQVADTMSTAYSLGGQEELASWQEGLRDAILIEVLRRDPSNDLANELHRNYVRSWDGIGESAREEVAAWRWAPESQIDSG